MVKLIIKNMKKIYFCLWLLIPATTFAQQPDTLGLDTCYQLAKEHAPLLQQSPLLKQQLDLAIQNLNSRHLPQLSFNAQATYQSDVTTIPFKIPNQQVPEVPKDQYRATLDLQQLIFDGGRLQKQRGILQTSNDLSMQQQDILFHQLKNQLSDLYESALMLQTDQQILDLKKQTLQQQINLAEASVKNGTALPSKKDKLQAAALELEQQLKSLQSDRQAVLQTLSLMTGKKWDDSTRFILPSVSFPTENEAMDRPELKQFDMQKTLVAQNMSLLQTENIPELTGFVQGGYGRPGLNMLSDQFKWFYMAGLRLNWRLWDWGYRRRQQQSLETDSRQIDLQKENFLLETQIKLGRQMQAIRFLQDDIDQDRQIVALREKISQASAAQLANGIITPTEYLIQLNDETSARITQQTHLIQLIFAKLNYQLLKSH
ncbi:MAG: TolC family protein [Chitinophagaceae bacterium]|nr:MAG: TolC family protein [Chitinophagaceae bacterium]